MTVLKPLHGERNVKRNALTPAQQEHTHDGDDSARVDHGSIEGITSDQHHTRYTDAEAVAAVVAAGGILDLKFVRKTTDETVTSTITPQADDELTLAVPASSVWLIEASIIYSSSQAADFRFTWGVPAGATGITAVMGIADVATSKKDVTQNHASTDLAYEFVRGGIAVSATEGRVMLVHAMITIAGTAGSITVKWAQGASTAVLTRVFAGSTLKAKRMA
jgi:hypothetical protein